MDDRCVWHSNDAKITTKVKIDLLYNNIMASSWYYVYDITIGIKGKLTCYEEWANQVE